MSWPDVNGRLVVRIFYRQDRAKDLLCVGFLREAKTQPLELSVPVATLGSATHS